MKIRISLVALFLSTLFSFNVLAMNEYKDPVRPTPQNEQKNDDRTLDYRWVWLDDETCVRFNVAETAKKDTIKKQSEMGLLRRWAENGTMQSAKVIMRESYKGKWLQSNDGTKSFVFEDNTIPVGVTNIDGVLYAFNTYGELKAGYEYYNGLKTEADGLVKADSAEFTQWLATQYLPECTSHE